MRDEVYWLERGKIAIATKSGDTFTSPSSVLTFRVTAITHDYEFSASSGATLIDPSESPAMPVQFHEALVAGVLEKMYAKTPDGVQLSQFWEQKYRQHVIEAKKYANNNPGNINLDHIEYLPLIPNPGKIICVGLR